MEAKRERVTRHDLRHDRHTVSLLTDHLWAPSCYHGSVGQGWEVVEKYISGQKGYENADIVPEIAGEKEKAHKTWYISLYNKLFGGKHQK